MFSVLIEFFFHQKTLSQ